MAKRITLIISLSLVGLIAATFIALAFIPINIGFTFADPAIINIYSDGNAKSPLLKQEFETMEYYDVVESMEKSFKKSVLKSMFAGELSNKLTTISYTTTHNVSLSSGTWLVFDYSVASGSEKQYVLDEEGNKLENSATYEKLAIKLNSENATQNVMVYLGSFNTSTKTFSYKYAYSTYGNLSEVYNIVSSFINK